MLDDLSAIDHTVDVKCAIDELKEDLFQVVFPHDQLIDIGWCPEFSQLGRFKVVLISNLCWTVPIYYEEASSWGELDAALSNALKRINL